MPSSCVYLLFASICRRHSLAIVSLLLHVSKLVSCYCLISVRSSLDGKATPLHRIKKEKRSILNKMPSYVSFPSHLIQQLKRHFWNDSLHFTLCILKKIWSTTILWPFWVRQSREFFLKGASKTYGDVHRDSLCGNIPLANITHIQALMQCWVLILE